MLYKYGMRLRGFSLGCQPMNGFVERQDDTTRKYHDILLYNRQLTEEELKNYELDYLGSDGEPQELLAMANLLDNAQLEARATIGSLNKGFGMWYAEYLYKRGYRAMKPILEKFANQIKLAFYEEFDELIPSIMADKIDNLVKEFLENE